LGPYELVISIYVLIVLFRLFVQFIVVSDGMVVLSSMLDPMAAVMNSFNQQGKAIM
jgi:hypothetical protein